MKLVIPVLVQIQGQREIANQMFLDTPWLIAGQPSDSRISFEPIVQNPLACSERHPAPTSHTSQFNT
jgi:hypothetical protein